MLILAIAVTGSGCNPSVRTSCKHVLRARQRRDSAEPSSELTPVSTPGANEPYNLLEEFAPPCMTRGFAVFLGAARQKEQRLHISVGEIYSNRNPFRVLCRASLSLCRKSDTIDKLPAWGKLLVQQPETGLFFRVPPTIADRFHRTRTAQLVIKGLRKSLSEPSACLGALVGTTHRIRFRCCRQHSGLSICQRAQA